MSCFGGLMEEYRYLSIDRFNGQNLFSSAFFLSHFHADHIVGLPEPEFRDLLETRKDVHLYCSEVTKWLLLADERFKNWEEYIVSIPIEDPTVIVINHKGQSLSIAVTLISAGHCPGSVMFLFEGDEGNVLYTGDFRLPKGSASRIRPLHLYDKTKKQINSIYVDTTFCSTNSVYIPKREDCLASLIDLLKTWFDKDTNNVVRMNLSAKYGYEFLFHALSRAFKCKIYSCRRHLYRSLPLTYHILTDKPEMAKIYACFKTDKVEVEGRSLNILKIILSTYYFTLHALPDQVYEKVSNDCFRFCFSFHSSYSEVCDFVEYVNPGNVYANVIPFCRTPLEEVAHNLAVKCGVKPRKLPIQNTKPAVGLSSAATMGDDYQIDHEPQFDLKATPTKRALSFSPDKSTQDLWDNIVKKAKTKRDFIANRMLRSETPSPKNSEGSTNISVPCSPNCKEPSVEKIEMLHVKLAMGDDLP